MACSLFVSIPGTFVFITADCRASDSVRRAGGEMARICIDGFNLALPEGSGIATYARNLNASLNALGHETQILFGTCQALGDDNLLNQIALSDSERAGKSGRFQWLRRALPRFRARAKEIAMEGDVITSEIAARIPAAGRIWGCRDVFHAANTAHGIFGRFTPLMLGDGTKTDVMHWTAPLPLFEPRMPNVYTLHDLIPLRLPFTTLDNKRAYYKMCKTIAQRADRIFTVSEHSRADIIRMLGVEEDRVVNTYQAVEIPERLLTQGGEEIERELRGVFDLEYRGYFLYFGALEPKKNLKRVVEAYRATETTRPLVIVGRAWLDAAQKRRLGGAPDTDVIPEFLAASDRIRRFPYLPFSLLVTLIRGARAALFPSLYEGFGLPVLEAMQLGTAVLTSTAGSLPEVAGDAALFVDPYDTDAIAKGIAALDVDDGLREDLIAKGRRQASLFSAERYRTRLRDAYAPLL